jgi:hypothetical protein
MDLIDTSKGERSADALDKPLITVFPGIQGIPFHEFRRRLPTKTGGHPVSSRERARSADSKLTI